MKKVKVRFSTDLSVSELYALQRAARSPQAREVARLIRAGVHALARFARRAISVPNHAKEISHA
jgi:hypothetical protein